jgi:hypothetical protein
MTQPETELAVDGVKVETLEELLNASMDLASEALTQELLQAASERLPEQETVVGIPEPVPLEAAAFLLGITATDAKERIKQGNLRGFKIKTKKGKQWFVDPGELNNCQPAAVSDDSAAILLEPDQASCSIESQFDPLELLCDKQLEIIREIQKTVEALTYRNGYLEAQLTEKDSQIKLLTDNQAARQNEKRGFWAWLLGTKK